MRKVFEIGEIKEQGVPQFRCVQTETTWAYHCPLMRLDCTLH